MENDAKSKAYHDYMQNVSASPQFSPAGETTEERIAWVIDTGVGVIGTPDDAVAQIRRLHEMTDGGFGSYLIMGNEWASHAATRRSVELFAEYVMPVFQDDATSRLRESEQWCRERRSDLFERQATALDQAAARHHAERDAIRASVAG